MRCNEARTVTWRKLSACRAGTYAGAWRRQECLLHYVARNGDTARKNGCATSNCRTCGKSMVAGLNTCAAAVLAAILAWSSAGCGRGMPELPELNTKDFLPAVAELHQRRARKGPSRSHRNRSQCTSGHGTPSPRRMGAGAPMVPAYARAWRRAVSLALQLGVRGGSAWPVRAGLGIDREGAAIRPRGSSGPAAPRQAAVRRGKNRGVRSGVQGPDESRCRPGGLRLVRRGPMPRGSG